MFDHDLTLGIARGACVRREGSTDLSRLNGTGSLPPRAMLLTRQGISLGFSSLFPEGPDFILICLDSSVWLSGVYVQRPPPSDDRPPASSEARAETSRNLRASLNA